MTYCNQLEPASLAAHFAAHPPEGFDLLTSDATATPAFAAPFDLTTTLDPALKRRLQALPLYRHWSRLLRWRTAFVGTTVSEYALLPADVSVQSLAQGWRHAWGGRYPLLIVKDIPQQSPLLSAHDNARADALSTACADAGYLLLEGQALAYVSIDFADTDAYLARLSSSRRKNLRRKLRSLERLEVSQRPTGDAQFADEAVIDRYHALYLAVHAQSEIHFDTLSRAFFAAVLRDGTSNGVVFEYRVRGAAQSDLIGWNLCYESQGKLIDKYIGLAYPVAREHDLYFVSWMVNLRHAVERGLSHYVAGWTDPQVKAQLGARFTFTRHAVYIRNPLLRALGRRLAGHFEGDRHLLAASP